jgi:phosphoribosyl-ATP pyrophosphohydrolase/phosphoribosyl-AMP cyclohydrolase
MVIASIDLQGGKAVQLKQGRELVLERDNPAALAEEFDRYGEVAIIDLDAAMGKGSNLEIIKTLLRKAECRVGGGIKSAEQAKELLSLGARKVIVGSRAFRTGDEFKVNKEFLKTMSEKIGKEHLIVAVDAKYSKENSSYEIVIDGWKTPTGLSLIGSAIVISEYVSEILFTCVDREGTMTGIDLNPVEALSEAVAPDCAVTVAGGVTTIDEIERLAALGCDVQLGMALYTGAISLADAFVRSLNWKKYERQNWCVPDDVESRLPLIPVIAQSGDGQVLMTGFADREAVAETFKRGSLCLYSRTRGVLWMKGENSGNTLKLIRLRADCDRDAILAVVNPSGPVCHKGAWSCFGTSRRYTLEYLQSVIAERFKNPAPGSYTATLDDELVREKVMEEAEELCSAKTHDEIVWEAADLFYFSTALITRAGVTIEEILNELDRRHGK